MTNLYDHTGKKIGEAVLPKEVFGAPVNGPLLAQALYVYKQNQTQGTKHAKSRGEVDLTKKKVYRQKGTGGARHGAKSAPIFVGGGQAHGPKGNLRGRLLLNAKMRRLSLISALSSLASKDTITVVKDLDKLSSKTKDINTLLEKINVKKGLLLVSESYPKLSVASANIGNLKVSRYNLTNVYELLNSKHLLLDETSLSALTKWLTGKAIEVKKAAKTIKKTAPKKAITKK